MQASSAIKQVAGVEMVYVNCALCGKNDTQTLYEPWNTEVDLRTVLSASGGVRGTQYIVKCNHCGLIYANPRPRAEEVIDGYSSAIDEIYVGAAAGRTGTFRRCVELVDKYAARGKLLDVGCAAGFFVKAASDAGWDAMGVEPCRWLANYGINELGVKVLPLTLSEAKFPDHSFDVVTIWDVLEHVPDPLAELHEIFRILRPGGLFMVNYPDAGTWQAKLAGKHWWFYLSVHLTYFTRDTVQAMMRKAGFGDFVIRPHYQSLELGHLMKMVGLYSDPLSRFGLKACQALRIDGLPIRYYASQTNVMARKPRA